MDFEAVLTEAHSAATAAIAAKGPENPNAIDCGFAWVKIVGTDPLARYGRKMTKGHERDYDKRRRYGSNGEPGWQWWKPGGFSGQAIDHHRAGAAAFAEVLARYGYRADVGSRYD